MIQRMQTIWLLLASASAFLSLKMPFYTGSTTSGAASYELKGMENYYLMMLTIAIGFLALIILFLFKNRRMQIRLSVLGIMLELGLIFLYYRQVTTMFSSGTYALSALLQGLTIFFFFFAIRGISNDAKIIRD
ncbi:MAG: DUF4293 family protein, partial [Ferruginibacter sp.]